MMILTMEEAENYVGFDHRSTHYNRFRSGNLTNDRLCLDDPTRPISTGHVGEIAWHIMLLVDSSLITSLLSISNYTGCLAECEGR